MKEEGKKRLEELVRQLRQDLTQKEFAEKLGISQSGLSMWEAGKVTPDLKSLGKLAEVWGKTPEELVAFLYGRKLINGSLHKAVEAMSINELVELQLVISRQVADKVNKIGKK